MDRMIITGWVPLMDTDKENGGMGVMAGSHAPAKVGTDNIEAVRRVSIKKPSP